MRTLCIGGVPFDHLLFGSYCRSLINLENTLLLEVKITRQNSSARTMARSHLVSDWWGLFFFLFTSGLKVWLMLLSGRRHHVSMRFHLIDLVDLIWACNLENAIHLSPALILFFLTWLLATLSPYCFRPLIFLHNTSNTCGSQALHNADCNWMKCKAPRQTRAGWKDLEPHARQSPW